MSCRTAFNFLTLRLACVFRLTTNRPLLVLPQECVKPRKSKVSGRRCPAAARRSAANRPNSISWVLPSWSDRPNCASLSLSGTVNLIGSGHDKAHEARSHEGLCPSGHAGDLGPGLEGLGPGGSILAGGEVIAAEMEQVVDLIVSGEEALGLAG